VPAIRKVLGCSRRLVEKHVNLYREFSGPDYAFMMAKVRRLAEAHPVKKTNLTGGMSILEAKKGCTKSLRHPSCQGCITGTNCSLKNQL